MRKHSEEVYEYWRNQVKMAEARYHYAKVAAEKASHTLEGTSIAYRVVLRNEFEALEHYSHLLHAYGRLVVHDELPSASSSALRSLPDRW